MTLVACERVGVRYGRGETRVVALEDVTIEVGVGERLALVGRSGSGKTTLLHVLGGLLRPTEGTVHSTHAGRPGFVFQGSNLLPAFTVAENVAFAAWVGGSEDVPGLLELVGLGGKGAHLPWELSGGEAQRVAIARSLAQRPELLLCDEPTGHLDSDTAERVLDLVDALQAEIGFALVIASHDPDVAARLARGVELVDGRIVGALEAA